MKRETATIVLAISAVLLSGCVDRRYVIYTDPPSATVLRNGKPLGMAPVDDHFLFYGNYDFTIIKDGYETKQVHQDIPAPWYEWPLIDFISEQLIPWRIEDRREFHYQLEPRRVVNPEELRRDADALRARGHNLPAYEAQPPEPVPTGAPPANPAVPIAPVQAASPPGAANVPPH